MNERNIIPCRPAKLDGFATIPGLDLISVVTVEHTLIRCDGCGGDCWIGPKGVDVRRQLPGSLALCYRCCAKEIGAGNQPDVVVVLPSKPAPARGV